MAEVSKRKVAIYTRVSTHWQIDKDSLQVQRRELVAYSELVLGIADYVVFEDAGFSAKNTDRPEFQNMMVRIRSGEFSHLLVWKIDRISRNLLDFSSMYEELKELGVVFVSKNEQFDTSSAMGEAMLKIILVFAELERNITAERVTAVMISRANEGKWNGGHVPYGYAYDKDTGFFSVDEVEKHILLRIWGLYEDNQSLTYVCRKLNAEGLSSRNGKQWSPTTIRKLLVNKWYTGVYIYNTSDQGGKKKVSKGEDEWVVIQDHHPAIIDEARFDRMQLMLKRNQRGKIDRTESRYNKNVHIFAGLLSCGKCGGAMTATPGKRRANGWRPSIYCCNRRRNDVSACDNKYISDATIGPFVFNYIANIIKAKEFAKSGATDADIQKRLLKGSMFEPDIDIERDGLHDLCEVLRQGKTGIEFSYHTDPEDQNQVSARIVSLNNTIRSNETALNRLRTIYLFDEESFSEKDYVIENKKLKDTIETAKRELEAIKAETGVQSEDPLMSGSEFIEKASYFIMVEKLLDEKEIDYEHYIRNINMEIPQSFLRNIISKITVYDGKVTSITFNSGITNKFIYK